MSKISSPAVRELTEAYIQLYLDNDRMTDAELTALKAERATEEIAYLDALDTAIRPDDFLSPEEQKQIGVPDFMQKEFEKKYAPALRYGWLRDIAPRVTHRFGHRDLDIEGLAQIAESLTTFSTASMPEGVQDALAYYGKITMLNMMAAASIAMSETSIATTKLTLELARDVRDMKLGVLKTFGTPQQIRQAAPDIRKEYRETKRTTQEAVHELKKINRKITHNRRKNWVQKET